MSLLQSLGVRRYLSALGYVTAVVGNSSSGLLEVPSAHIPTLNIGDRQKGRTRGASVVDVASDKRLSLRDYKKSYLLIFVLFVKRLQIHMRKRVRQRVFLK